jgi:hypothetical protein
VADLAHKKCVHNGGGMKMRALYWRGAYPLLLAGEGGEPGRRRRIAG